MRQADCGRRWGVRKWKAKIGIDKRKILTFFVFIGVLVFVFETLFQKKNHYRIIINRRQLVIQICRLVAVCVTKRKLQQKRYPWRNENATYFHPHVLVAGIPQKIWHLKHTEANNDNPQRLQTVI